MATLVGRFDRAEKGCASCWWEMFQRERNELIKGICSLDAGGNPADAEEASEIQPHPLAIAHLTR